METSGTTTLFDALGGFSYGYLYLFTGQNRNAAPFYLHASSGTGTNFPIGVPVYRHSAPGLMTIGMSLYDALGKETISPTISPDPDRSSSPW